MPNQASLTVDDRPQTLTEVIKRATSWPQNGESTIIVICHKKSNFLNQLTHEVTEAETQRQRDRRSLARPTLNFLQAAQKVRLFYCSNLMRFRAFTTTLALDNDDNNTGKFHSRIVIVDMLALHHGTSESTIQGLSRSFSMIASVQHDLECHMELVECTDIRDSANPGRGHRLWDTQVPLLSSSIKIGEVGKQWISRSTNIRDLADRWFDFAKLA